MRMYSSVLLGPPPPGQTAAQSWQIETRSVRGVASSRTVCPRAPSGALTVPHRSRERRRRPGRPQIRTTGATVGIQPASHSMIACSRSEMSIPAERL